MKILCTQENLSHGLSLASHITGRNASLPILNNILLKAERGRIEFSATNLELALLQSIRGKIEEEGALTVPGRIVAEYISLLEKSETVTLASEGTQVLIQSKRATTKIHGLPAEDYPLIPRVENTKPFQCSGPALRGALTGVAFAAATDDARPEISGIFFRCDETTLTVAATDSYRLAESTVPLQEKADERTTAIVPSQTIQELLRLLGPEEEMVTFFLAENQIVFSYGDTKLLSRLIDGQFPNYEQILPTTHETEARVNTEAMAKAVKSASLFTRPGIHDLTLTLSPKNGSILFEAANANIGENKQEIEAGISGRENSIVFNTRYLLDGLSAFGSGEALFQMTSAASPGAFRREAGNYLYIIMPIKQ